MIKRKEVNECTCWCGHRWLSEEVPKRCAGKGKHRDWNSRDPRPSLEKSKLEADEVDPFTDPETFCPPKPIPPEKPQSSGSKTEELLARMASKLGRPSHAPNCTCFICKPPKADK